MAWWLKFPTKGAGCVDTWHEAEARVKGMAIKGEAPIEVFKIPYPASPLLFQDEGRNTPTFCMQPERCKGRGSCPRSHACND